MKKQFKIPLEIYALAKMKGTILQIKNLKIILDETFWVIKPNQKIMLYDDWNIWEPKFRQKHYYILFKWKIG